MVGSCRAAAGDQLDLSEYLKAGDQLKKNDQLCGRTKQRKRDTEKLLCGGCSVDGGCLIDPHINIL